MIREMGVVKCVLYTCTAVAVATVTVAKCVTVSSFSVNVAPVKL